MEPYQMNVKEEMEAGQQAVNLVRKMRIVLVNSAVLWQAKDIAPSFRMVEWKTDVHAILVGTKLTINVLVATVYEKILFFSILEYVKLQVMVVWEVAIFVI